jgi:cytochrome c-type biogenesis protein CcmH/NrfG
VIDTYGWILLRAGDNKRGLSLLAQAAERAPKNLDVQTHFALALEVNGQADRAREIVEQVLASDRPFDSRALAVELRKKLGREGA